MTAPDPRRWPLAPLLTYLRLTPHGFAQLYGLRPDDVRHARDHGLTDAQADTWTIAADLHPALIWPDWCDAVDELGELEADELRDAA